MNRKWILGFLAIGTFLYLAKGKVTQFVNNIIPGTPSIKGFSVLANNTIFSIQSLSDFRDTAKDILQSISFNDIISLNFPKVDFQFDLDLPLTNGNNFALPNNRWSGSMSVGGKIVGNVAYDATDLPANETTVLKINVRTSISNSVQLVKALLQKPNSILNGADFKGNFESNGQSIPFNFNAKFF